MKRLLISLTLILLSAAAFSQSVTGDWYGLLTVPTGQLPLIMHITKTDAGFAATLDSPDQKALGIPMDKVTFADNKLAVSFAAGGLNYSGTFMPDSSKINGTFQQGTGSFPLVLTREKQAAKPVEKPEDKIRPQDPKDFPYLQEDVVFTNPKAGDQLSGTITMPADRKATKIVVLITGSGPQNRNEEFPQFNHRPFLVLSDWLTRNGIAVLRYDDRGTAKSTGDFKTATSADFADDAEAAVNYIKSRSDLKKLSIGLIGHSEGGMIAPIVAGRNENVKFMVLLAGPGIPIAKLMVQQTEDVTRAGGGADSVIKGAVTGNEMIYSVITDNKELSTAALKVKLDSALYDQFRTFRKGALGNLPIDQVVASTSATVLKPWYRYFLAFNPADFLVKVKCPTLAINGTLDTQVKCEPNLQAIRAALTKAGNKNVEIVPLPGLNHMFQKAVTGSVPEYGQLTETVNPAALEKVSSWINQLH